MTHDELQQHLLALPEVTKEYPFGESIAVYRTNTIPDQSVQQAMFALVKEGSEPIQLSLRSDRRLAAVLRERYESIQPGENLDKRRWNTLLLTGQLADDEVKDLIRHSYELVQILR